MFKKMPAVAALCAGLALTGCKTTDEDAAALLLGAAVVGAAVMMADGDDGAPSYNSGGRSWSNDGQCDDPRYRRTTGAARPGTDEYDCATRGLGRGLKRGYDSGYDRGYDRGERDRYANNGRCDDARYRTSNGGRAAPGSDEYDCSVRGLGFGLR